MFIINNLGGGGAERVVSNLCKGMGGYEKYGIIFENIVEQKVEATVISIESPPSKNIFKKILKFFVRFFKIKKLKKQKIKPDYAISLLEPCNFLNVITKSKEKTILSFHSHYSVSFPEALSFTQSLSGKILFYIYKTVFKFLYNRADVLVSVSRGVAQDLIKNFGLNPNKMKVIYNPFPIEEIEKLSKEELGNYEPIFKYPVLISAGRLTKQKGHWYLLRIFKKLKEKYSNLKLIILGEGKLKDYLVEFSQNLNLKTFVWDRDTLSDKFDVYFLGFQKNPFKFISRSKIFVLPSLWEGFGNVLVEAMACGIPVVSSDCKSGPREIIAPEIALDERIEKPFFGEYGILIPPFESKFKSPEETLEEKEKMWIEVLEKLLNDEELRKNYSIKAKQRSRDFTLEKIVREWENIFQN